MHTRRERIVRVGRELKEPQCSTDPAAASFFSTNFAESLVHRIEAFHREILTSFSSTLFLSVFFFCHFLARFFMRPCRLSSSFTDISFRSMSPIVANSRVIRVAFNKIELSFCGWYFWVNSPYKSIVYSYFWNRILLYKYYYKFLWDLTDLKPNIS